MNNNCAFFRKSFGKKKGKRKQKRIQVQVQVYERGFQIVEITTK